MPKYKHYFFPVFFDLAPPFFVVVVFGLELLVVIVLPVEDCADRGDPTRAGSSSFLAGRGFDLGAAGFLGLLCNNPMTTDPAAPVMTYKSHLGMTTKLL